MVLLDEIQLNLYTLFWGILSMAASKIKLAYLASGGGSSVANLVSMIQDGRLEGFASRVVLCDKREGKAGIYDRREHLGIPVLYAPTEQRQLKTLKVYQPDLILGLGFVKKVGDCLLYTSPSPRDRQ